MKSSALQLGLLFTALIFLGLAGRAEEQETGVVWRHLSSKNGDLPAPNTGTEQTSAVVADFDKDGINDFAISERTQAPAVVWYRRNPKGWVRHILESGPLHIEAGSCAFDVDGDGDLDFVAGGDWKLNEVWWWENSFPDFDSKVSWKRHLIKNSDKPKHHDLIFGDFNLDGRDELVFWNQDSQKLYLATIPADPQHSGPWPLTAIYNYSNDSEMQQQGKPAGFKGVNEHEGLAKGDIDGDGKLDIVGGGRWFKHVGGNQFLPNIIDAGYSFSRSAVGDLKKGGRPEVVLVVGDGEGPLNWYEWVKGTWVPHTIVEVNSGHSLALLDFNNDGNLDIFCAEMRLNGGNPEAKCYLFLGDGNGNFKKTIVSIGIGYHESKIADLDGNGTLDILDKPYDWDTPRLDIWLNLGPTAAKRW